MRRANVINETSLKFIDQHRKELRQQHPDFKKFMATYEVPQSLIDDIIAAGKKKKIEAKDDKELQKTLPDLRFTLKSLIIYDIWDRSEYFQFVNRRSDIVKKGLEIIKK